MAVSQSRPVSVNVGTGELTYDTTPDGQLGARPVDYGLRAWAGDPAVYTGQTILGTAGLVHVVEVNDAPAGLVTNLHIYLGAAGASLTSGQNFAGLYDANKSLLSATGDQSTAWASTGLKTMALTTPQSVAGGTLYVAFFCNGSTLITPLRSSLSPAVNLNLSAANSRFATADTGRTTSLPVTLGTFTALSTAYWVALS